MASTALKAPFPYFGGKSRVASEVWARFGPVKNYVEPFFGSGAMLLNRPDPPGIETVNDVDGLICNFWRAVQADPEQVASYADWPVNANDQNARHAWLVARKDSLQAKLEGDPDFYCAKIAGWWGWGVCCWIGTGWCSGKGPWHVVDGQLVHLGNAGQGVHRKLVHLGDAGRGVHRQLVHLGNAGQGEAGITAWFEALAERLRRVRVACGDWSKVVTPAVTWRHGLTGVFLDPPYSAAADRKSDCYRCDDEAIADKVRVWAIRNLVKFHLIA